MLEIIPSVNAETWEKVRDQILKVAPHADWIELDIFDGKFVKRISWNNPEDLKNFITEKTVRLAAHLMIQDPQLQLEPWIKAGVRRIIVQWEAIKPRGPLAFLAARKVKNQVQTMLKLCQENWVEFGISLSPASKIKEIAHFLPELNLVQVLANAPGSPGRDPLPQAFLLASELNEIRRKQKFGYKLEWDIGVNPDTLDAIKATGADLACATSFIFNAANPVQALEHLHKKARGLI